FTKTPVLSYPSFEIPPYTPLSPDPGTIATRLSTLYNLQENDTPCILLTSAEAVLRRILPKNILNRHCELVMAGEDTDRDGLIASLTEAGYQLSDMVRQQGDIAVRGGIVDIFAPAADPDQTAPLRLDFFGDTIESIRVFDPLTQRSKADLQEAILLPASDLLFPATENTLPWNDFLGNRVKEYGWTGPNAAAIIEQLSEHIRFPGIEFVLPLVYPDPDPPQTLFDYLPENPVMVLHDPVAIRQQVDLVWERILANHLEAHDSGVGAVPPQHLFLSRKELDRHFSSLNSVRLCTLPDPDNPVKPVTIETGDHTLLGQEIELQRKKRGILAPLADRIIDWHDKGEVVILACKSTRQARHLDEMLGGYQLQTMQLQLPIDLEAVAADGLVRLALQPLSRGFDLHEEKLHILSASEIFGEKRLRITRTGKTKKLEGKPVQVETLAPGDIVVHRDHGLGSFQGLINMEFTGQRGDFMQIEFRDGDKLYVPVDRLHWVSRYQGLTDQQPRLDRLGSQRWQSTKKKVTDAVWKVAQELLDIYARRATCKGHRFQPPGELYNDLEQSFPFEETPGQANAIEEVLDDLTSEQPMDRLVCGDVGYGKTEVAVRAAFKVIEDGFQVAMLVPTTVLAEQHAATFRERFSSFPVEVACLNRFRTTAQQKSIIRDLSEGRLDLVVGTHRLLSGDVIFNKPGLLIVDEEHRFGVTHKEKRKKLRASVDVLTLTATPIPRTLQMSLLGIRDMSVISTPPQARRSVKTFLARHDQLVIREAAVRELQRGGQLFFVHNRVRSINRIAETIEKLVPHARIAVAHGQMPGRQLENIMIRFINHEVDILVCTTIIESGLDIPNANTIIINRADHLGLADIYQLRGRVGRSSRQSYAYLLVPSLDSLTKDAKQRLRALMDCSELGGGFKLAMNDLQIRGGGNLLGVSQSGHIASVGYDLYLELLQSTVKDLKKKAAQEGTSVEPELEPEVNLKVTAFLPDDYIKDTAQRYHMYRRLSNAGNSDPEDLENLRDELVDRYGSLPPEASTLFQMIGLKYRLRQLGISKLEQGPEALIFSFIETSPVDPQTILSLINQKPAKKQKTKPIRLTPDHRLIVPLENKKNLFTRIHTVL
ncbi:MAG: transcription-repair coupling factor, partial [Desulfobulbaceae bacterium]|nr:transcription-repair coupling factor [Desulfobulbaceae bacterium]